MDRPNIGSLNTNNPNLTAPIAATGPQATSQVQPKKNTRGHRRRRRRPRKRPEGNIKRWRRAQRKATAPFEASGSAHPSGLGTDDDSEADSDSNTDDEGDDQHPGESVNAETINGERTHFYYVPLSRQQDPHPMEPITEQKTLQMYHRLSFGTCIIAPLDKPSFCKVRWIPFNQMSPSELNGWEKLVFHLLERCNHISPVKGNGAQTGGMMWADGWRKSSDPDQSVGRFCCVEKMKKAMERARYNPVSEAAGIQEASDFISLQLQQFAPGVFESCRQLLIDGNYPSMAQMEWPAPYTPNDFASFLTFTMFNFFNQPHQDSDVNNWTLVIWIPIFNPRTRTEDDLILADEGFDMEGGQFTFRDFQVYLDLTEVLGVTMCVFKSNSIRHQTLPGHSRSGKYTRI
ncbi:hypothetical protein PCASD_12942, partial [Puccinia coronata f. sp. avenae]